MNLDYESFTDPEILGVLHQARVVPRRSEIVLQRYPVNHSRKESLRRNSFRIWSGNSSIIHLVVGPSLGSLQRKTAAFCRHNPDIACRPLFFFQRGGLDFLGQESRGLYNLEEALSAGRIDRAGWHQAVHQMASALASTARASTPAQLMREMEAFEQSVLGIAALTRIDQVFLRDTVFPLLRQEAGRQPIATAWTNGDFIAKNIVLDRDNQARLIDYEFAQRSHFAASDWFRLRHFSSVPDLAPVPDLSGQTELPAWLELRGWLEHAVKMNAVCSPAVALADLGKISEQVARLVEVASKSKQDSVFFSLAPGASLTAPVPATVTEDEIVVEWSRQASSPRLHSRSIALPAHEWTEVQVDLTASPGRTLQVRLQLPSRPGMLEFRSVEIYGRERDKVLWTVASSHLGEVVTCTGNLLETPTADGLGLIHFGGESSLTLPPIRLAKSETVQGLVFWVRYVPTLLEFSQRLRQAYADGDLPTILSLGQPLAQIEAGPSASPVTAQLFIPAGDSYGEENSTRSSLRDHHGWTELAYDIPALPVGAVLRFDPADRPGFIEIAHLALGPAEAKDSPNPVARAQPLRDWQANLCAEGDAVLMQQDGTSSILCFGPDPILKLAPLDNDLAGRPCRLSLTLRYTPNAPATAWATALRAQNREVINLNVRLHEQIVQGETSESALHEQLNRAEASQAALHEQLNQEARRVREAEEKVVASQQEAQQARVAEADLAAHRRELAEARTRMADLAAAEAQLKAALEAAQQANLQWQDRLAAESQVNSVLTADWEAAKAQNGRLVTEITELRSTIEATQEAARRREQEFSALAAEQGQQLQAARERESALGQSVADQSRRVASLAAELVSSQGQIAALNGQIREALQARGQIEESLASAERRDADQRENITGLEQQLSRHHADLTTARRDFESLQERLQREALEKLDLLQKLAAAKLDATQRKEAQDLVVARLKESVEDTGAALAALHEKHEKLVESLYAQNEELLNYDFQAGLLAAERDQTTVSLAAAEERLRELERVLQQVSQRPLIRMDRMAAKLLTAAAAKEKPARPK